MRALDSKYAANDCVLLYVVIPTTTSNFTPGPQELTLVSRRKSTQPNTTRRQCTRNEYKRKRKTETTKSKTGESRNV
jgi:hypothetical protein